jgi:DNA-binding CsgD family transcriptional regulator
MSESPSSFPIRGVAQLNEGLDEFMGIVCPGATVLALVVRTNLFQRPPDGGVGVFCVFCNCKRSKEAILSRKPKESPRELTLREKEVAGILARTGLSYKQAASELDIREGTMRKHAENVYRKKGVHSRAELTVILLGKNE